MMLVISTFFLTPSGTISHNLRKATIRVDYITVTDKFPRSRDFDVFIEVGVYRVFGTVGDRWSSDSGYADYSLGWTRFLDDALLDRLGNRYIYKTITDSMIKEPSGDALLRIRLRMTWGWFETASQISAAVHNINSFNSGTSQQLSTEFTFSRAGGNIKIALTITYI